MRKQHSWHLLSLLLALVSIFQANPALYAFPLQQEETVSLLVFNQSSSTVCYIYVADETGQWGEERLQGAKLVPNGKLEIVLVAGVHHIVFMDCNGDELVTQYNLEIAAQYTLAFSDQDIKVSHCNKQFQIGRQQYQSSEYSAALESLEVALDCFRNIGDSGGEGDTLNNIALTHYNLGQNRKALEFYQQALTLAEEAGDRSDQATTLYNMGLVYDALAQYDQAMELYQKALTITQALDDLYGQGAIFTGIGAIYFRQGRYDESLVNYQSSLAIRQTIKDRHGEGVTLASIGLVHKVLGQLDDALKSYEQALEIQREIGDRTNEAATQALVGAIYREQGRYQSALSSYEQALKIQQQIGDRTGEAATRNGMAGVYRAQGMFNDALRLYTQALIIRQAIGARAGEGDTINSIGLIQQTQGRYDDALATYYRALDIQQELGDRAGEGTTLNNIASVFHEQGRFGEALTTYERALAIEQRIRDFPGMGTTLTNIGGIYSEQRRYDKALEAYEQALAIRRTVSARQGEGVTLAAIGLLYYAQEQYEKAMEIYGQALLIAREIGNRRGEASNLTNIGLVYQATQQYTKALGTYQQALSIARSVEDRSSVSAALNNIAGVYSAQKRYVQALDLFQQSLTILYEQNDNVKAGDTLANIGEVYRIQGQYSNALDAYETAIGIYESIRRGAGDDQARTNYAESYASVYDRVIALSYQQGALEDAFAYSERGRARTFLDLLATGQVQLIANNASELLAMEQEAYMLRQFAQDALAKARAANPPDPTWVSEAEGALKEAEVAYQKASDAIAAHSDQLASLIPGRQKVLQLADVQALLDKDTTLLSYWMLEDRALAFVVTVNDAKIVDLPKVTSQTVLSATESLYKWTNKDNSEPKPLRELYQWLIAPLSDTLKTKHIAIIPHQQLHYVPFAALVDQSHNNQYFGEQHTLSIIPSASVLPFLQENAKGANANQPGNEVVFGDPATDQAGLSPLHYAEQEAAAVADTLDTKAITTTAATEASLHERVQGARVLHLAAHGEYNQGNALYSSIYLAPSQPVTSTQAVTESALLPTVDTSLDGRLETHEIFGLPLKGNNLVVLSACQTNVGDLSRGDEIVGLTRAFFFAGSPTVISSLWNVDDAATETLMVSFYTHWLKDGMSKSEALQAAQADVRADPRWASPFYWAGFVLNGHPGVAASNIRTNAPK